MHHNLMEIWSRYDGSDNLILARVSDASDTPEFEVEASARLFGIAAECLG